MHNNVMGLKP